MQAQKKLCGAVAAAVFGFAGVAAADTVVNISGTETLENTGVAFEGSIAYDSDPAGSSVTVTLKNTSSIASILTGFVFNINGAVTAAYNAVNNVSTSGVDEGAFAFETGKTQAGNTSGPFGVWDAGAALVVLKNSDQIKAMNEGETGIFRFSLSGPDAGSLTADSFTSEFNTGSGLSSFFLARFQSVGPNGRLSDRMIAGYEKPPEAVPLPAAAWGGLALIGGLGVANRIRRRREQALDVE